MPVDNRYEFLQYSRWLTNLVIMYLESSHIPKTPYIRMADRKRSQLGRSSILGMRLPHPLRLKQSDMHAGMTLIFLIRKYKDSTNTLVPLPTGTNELFKNPHPVSCFQSTSNDLSGYHPWFHDQVANILHAVRQLWVGEKTFLENNAFERVFTAVATFVLDNEAVSIDDEVGHLRETQKMEGTREASKTQRLLVFAILGWQSMLNRFAFKASTPAPRTNLLSMMINQTLAWYLTVTKCQPILPAVLCSS